MAEIMPVGGNELLAHGKVVVHGWQCGTVFKQKVGFVYAEIHKPMVTENNH